VVRTDHEIAAALEAARAAAAAGKAVPINLCIDTTESRKGGISI
jgi:Tfp pilus assembly protein FimT